MTDEEVVKKVLLDHDFFICIIEAYEFKLRKYIYRYSGLMNGEADDILQDAFLKVFRNLRDFDFDLKFQNWIYRIVRNTMVDSLRKNLKHNKDVSTIKVDDGDTNIYELMASDEDLSQVVTDKEMVHLVAKIVNDLEEPYREVAILRFWEEKDYSEIGDIIRSPVGTVGSLVSRAKKIIIKKVEEEERHGN